MYTIMNHPTSLFLTNHGVTQALCTHEISVYITFELYYWIKC